ncbi:MAG: aconitate hydratase AcnA [Bdellovibrionales bacterium]|nr:aconitate hydratase AcnA [Bdellovibrionales bacterium]
MAQNNPNSFGTLSTLTADGKSYSFYSLKEFAKKSGKDVSKFPFSMKVLLENLLRHEDNLAVKKSDILAVAGWNPKAEPDREIQFTPARTVLQDLTGVPAVVDLAAMRAAMKRLGGDPNKINPLCPVDLVIDHSVQVDHFGNSLAFEANRAIEYERNLERYQFLSWGKGAFRNFRVVPPETGIIHQVNLEYLATVAMTATVGGSAGDTTYVFPDTCVGTDSHTTMINGLGVVGWGVGGIEAEAAMLGQPISMLIPQVIGFKLHGKLRSGVTATDLVLTITQMLRKKGVVGKFVEFYGQGVAELSLADRATIANMAPEYGATIGVFPVDNKTLDYLILTGRAKNTELVKKYYQEQGMWFDPSSTPTFTDSVDLDLATVEPSLAGPSRPQDRVTLKDVKVEFASNLPKLIEQMKDPAAKPGTTAKITVDGVDVNLEHGSVVIAAITSCTNTSNPSGLMTAGLLAKKAVEKGLSTKPWVKTSLAPGSKVVTDYLSESGLIKPLEALKFYLVGYGCTTCIGNAGPLIDAVSKAVTDSKLVVASVLSGNRNFEGRINAQVRANYLASPALVVAYAIAGSTNINLDSEPLGKGKDGRDVFLKDIWPTPAEVDAVVSKHVTREQFEKSYSDVFHGDELWQKVEAPKGQLYSFDDKSTYIKEPTFLQDLTPKPQPLTDVKGARILGLFGDSITTDHISPAGGIAKDSPAARHLLSLGIAPKDFNQYGARRGNHEIMVRGTFANVRIKNKIMNGVEGGLTKKWPEAKDMSIFDAAETYRKEGTPLVVIAGKEYGTGSSRDWAAKGTFLLGVRAVITESFERIHRSNLVGMGVIPMQFLPGENADSLGLKGDEVIDIDGITTVQPGQKLKARAKFANGSTKEFTLLCRIDTANELEYYKNGGILHYVIRQLLNRNQ